jgi:hypothetical protein
MSIQTWQRRLCGSGERERLCTRHGRESVGRDRLCVHNKNDYADRASENYAYAAWTTLGGVNILFYVHSSSRSQFTRQTIFLQNLFRQSIRQWFNHLNRTHPVLNYPLTEHPPSCDPPSPSHELSYTHRKRHVIMPSLRCENYGNPIKLKNMAAGMEISTGKSI